LISDNFDNEAFPRRISNAFHGMLDILCGLSLAYLPLPPVLPPPL
jgi:hypothetical protein